MIDEDSRRRQTDPQLKRIMSAYHISPEEEELFYGIYSRMHIYRLSIAIMAIAIGLLTALLLLK